MASVPAVDDPIWSALPEGIGLITDGDEIAGITFTDGVNVDFVDLNRFLTEVGLPPVEPPDGED